MTVCGWCHDPMTSAPQGRQPVPVSHGICPSCLQTRLAALDRRPLAVATAPAR